MNGRTSKLLQSYARTTQKPLKEVKREWNSTPRNERGEIRKEMQAGLWSTFLRDWRKRSNLLQKQAADFLHCSLDTYRKWEAMQMTPPKGVQIVTKHYIKTFQTSDS